MRKSLMLCGAAAILLCVGTAWGQVCERGASLYEQAMSAGKVQAKIQLLQDSISACPNYPALIELGKMYAGLNRLDESEAVLKQAQDLADDDESKASALAYPGADFRRDRPLSGVGGRLSRVDRPPCFRQCKRDAQGQ